MTLRRSLGPDAARVQELVDQLLDSEDSLIVLIDGRRAVSYAAGLGLSPCQLELLTVEIERAVRAVGGVAPLRSPERRQKDEEDPLRNGHRACGPRGGPDRRYRSGLASRGASSSRSGGSSSRDRTDATSARGAGMKLAEA